MIDPGEPADLTGAEDLLILPCGDRPIGSQGEQLLAQRRAKLDRNRGKEVLADQRLRLQAEQPRMRPVREGQPELGVVATDQLGLILDDRAELPLALAQSL